MRLSRLSVVLFSGLLACGSDDPTAPNVTYPTLPPAMLEAHCWQGNRTINQINVGQVSSADCDADSVTNVSMSTGYYESWRIRLPATQQVTLSVAGAFDNTLFVARIDSVTADSLAYTVQAENDDRAVDDFDARIVMTLEGGVDYLVGVTGFNKTQGGSYQLSIN